MNTILVVDDEAFLRGVIVRLLKQFEYPALEAGDGMTAMIIAQQHSDKICLAFIDRQMPGMSGEETINALRQTLPDLPVIFASASHDPLIDQSSGKSDCAYLHKPFGMKQLSDLIGHLLYPDAEAESCIAMPG
jgi:CheY-like chemotaxis protein